MQIPDDGIFGCILQVTIDYDKKLHDSHNDLPFLPEHLCPPGSKLPKLCTTFNRKTKYVLHHTVLKQILKDGLTLVKIHRI